MIREMELLFQASRTSPMLHEAAATVEAGIAALRAERDELVLWNERLGADIAAAEAENRRLREGLREILDCKGPYNGTVSERGGDPAVCPKCEEKARALLADSPDGAKHPTLSDKNPSSVVGVPWNEHGVPPDGANTEGGEA